MSTTVHSLEPADFISADAITSPIEPQIIICNIHGILSRGEWYHYLNEICQETLQPVIIKTCNYGFLGTIPFILSINKKQKVDKVSRTLRDINAQYPHCPIAIISHSFGTHLLTCALDADSTIRNIKYAFLFGSIVKNDDLTLISAHSKLIINDCGRYDIITILAEAYSKKYYEATGTYGFPVGWGNNVMNRFFDFGHSGATKKSHVKDYVWPLIVGDAFRTKKFRGHFYNPGMPGYFRYCCVGALCLVLSLFLIFKLGLFGQVLHAMVE